MKSGSRRYTLLSTVIPLPKGSAVIRSLVLLAFTASTIQAIEPKSIATGLSSPTAVAVGADGRTFVAVAGEFEKPGDGSVLVLKNGKAEPLATGLDDPIAMVAFQQSLFVADKTRIQRIDLKSGVMSVWVDEKDFPAKPRQLAGLAVDERGTLYVTETNVKEQVGGSVLRVTTIPQGRNKEPLRKVSLIAETKTHPFLQTPTGIAVDSLNHLLILDYKTGELNRLSMPDLSVEKVANGFAGGYGLTFDHFGRLYVSSIQAGKIWSIPQPGEKAVLMGEQITAVAGIGHEPNGNQLLYASIARGGVFTIPAQPPGWEVDETPLALQPEIAFGDVTWTGWDSGAETGKVNPLRPIVLTHAGDGSKRIFVATQHGVIHTIADKPGPQVSNVFLDLQAKVLYKDNENEQGLLGVAFHPKYKDNGELFLFYTDKSKRLQNVVSRFRVSKDDPNKVDPNSEEELLRISHKFWNHDGGTICFGPDGFLYIVLGDGGSANDPDENGQNKKTLLGKILRIDINKKDGDKAYGIPADNPFVNDKDTRPEIYCLGVRNPWRMAFDRKTGQGWFGEVGQNLWEEINLLEKGANYGWNIRESLHPFGAKGVGHRPDLIEPIWEYHHSVGKSITGGHVYRGKQLPELEGMYLYADYVSGKLWALKYDFEKKRVVANRPIKDFASPIMSYGEDENGEVYLLTFSPTGKGISKFVRTK
jgi:glucose/arabinose dehydrogenase